MRPCVVVAVCAAAMFATFTNLSGEEKSATDVLPPAVEQLGITPAEIISTEAAARVRGSGFFPDFLVENGQGFFPSFLTAVESGFRPDFLVEVDTGFFPDFLQKIEDRGFFPDFLTQQEKGFFPSFLTETPGRNSQ